MRRVLFIAITNQKMNQFLWINNIYKENNNKKINTFLDINYLTFQPLKLNFSF